MGGSKVKIVDLTKVKVKGQNIGSHKDQRLRSKYWVSKITERGQREGEEGGGGKEGGMKRYLCAYTVPQVLPNKA